MSKQAAPETCSNAGCQEILPLPLISSSESGPQRWRRHYRRLDEDVKEIRLIRVKSARKLDEPIECELFYTPLCKSPSLEEWAAAQDDQQNNGESEAHEILPQLDDSPHPGMRTTNFYWRALSHVWGPPCESETRIATVPIFLNGDEIRPRYNLRECLLSLRDHEYFEPIWIDALCINQADHKERASQVAMMRDVYSAAAEALIYLCFRFDKIPRDLDQDFSMALPASTLRSNESIAKAIVQWSLGTEESFLLDFIATILDEVKETYWSRLWTLQECAFARSINVISGPLHTSWETLLTVTQIAEDTRVDAHILRNELLEGETGDSHLKKIDQLVCYSVKYRESLRTKAEEEDLLPFLWKLCHETDCTDARDSIYGLACLADSVHKSIELDYTLCASCVWRRITEHIIAETGRLDVLTASAVKEKGIVPEKPRLSWVPSWANIRTEPPSDHYRFSPTTAAEWKLPSQSTVLLAEGVLLGSIIGPCYEVIVHDASPWAANSHIVTDLSAFLRANVKNHAHRRMCLEDLSVIFWESVEDKYLLFSTVQRVCTSTIDLLIQGCQPDEEEDVAHIYTNLNTLLGYQSAMLLQLTSPMSPGRPRLGIGDTHHARQSDVICGILGCNLPLIVRRHENGDQIIGTCLIPGYGRGQAIEELNAGKRTLETFRFL